MHRDVSPSNVLVGIDGTARLADFGLAKALYASSDQTATGILKGKTAYMAPEYVLHQRANAASDLFSLADRYGGAAFQRILRLNRIDATHAWQGDTLVFRRSGVDGQIRVDAKSVRVTVELGFLLLAIRGSVEREIRRYLDEEFG